MIRFEAVPEPASFDKKVRQRGPKRLQSSATAGKRPPDSWKAFYPQIRDGFRELCAYSAMYTADGTVDHFVSINEKRDLAYEWSNYRHVGSWMNSKKGALKRFELLDPFEVQDDWFELILPSLQLVTTSAIPEDLRELADALLKRLGLRDDERVIRQRRSWLEEYENGDPTIDALKRLDNRAPLIARAVRKRDAAESVEASPPIGGGA